MRRSWACAPISKVVYGFSYMVKSSVVLTDVFTKIEIFLIGCHFLVSCPLETLQVSLGLTCHHIKFLDWISSSPPWENPCPKPSPHSSVIHQSPDLWNQKKVLISASRHPFTQYNALLRRNWSSSVRSTALMDIPQWSIYGTRASVSISVSLGFQRS